MLEEVSVIFEEHLGVPQEVVEILVPEFLEEVVEILQKVPVIIEEVEKS